MASPPDSSFQDAIAAVTRTQQELDKRIFHLNTLYETAHELSGLNQPRKMMETFLLSAMGIFGITEGLVILINTRTYQGHLFHRGFSKEAVAACERNLTRIARHYLPPEGPPIGASAALCSLIGALLYYGKSRGGTYGKNIFSQIGGWAIGIGIFGFMIPGINNWGHGGGMLVGALLGYFLGYAEKKRERFWHKILAMGCLAATTLVLLWSCLNGILFFFLRN